MEDEQIISLLFHRAEAALTRMGQKYGRLCADVARHILTDERDVEECVNDAYLRAWNAIPPERPKSLGAYLARITRNLALDRYDYNGAGKRDCALTGAFEELETCFPPGVGVWETDAQELRIFLNDFLRAQPEEARRFFILRYWYGESIREIAKSCHAGEEKVKSTLFRTRNRLRNELKKEEISL